MVASRDARAATEAPSGNRAGPLPGWSWCEARHAFQLGKRQGAYAVEFRSKGVRYYVPEKLCVETRKVQTQPEGVPGLLAAACASHERKLERAPRARPSAGAGATAPAQSKRKQRSVRRLQEYQQKQRLRRCRLRKVALQVLRRLRHERLWRVFREWHATQASGGACDSAQHTVASAMVPMEVDNRATRAAPTAEEPPRAAQLSPMATEFIPGLSEAEVEAAWGSTAAAWGQARRPPTPCEPSAGPP